MQKTVFALIASSILIVSLTSWAVKPSDSREESSGAKALFDGKGFQGWKLFTQDEKNDPNTVWEAREGVIHCNGGHAGYIRTTDKYENYKLTFEWRWLDTGGNSGVLIHIQDKDEVWPKAIEGQLLSENAADFWVIGGAEFKEHLAQPNATDDRRVIKKHPHNEKPLGEWNTYEVVCDGNTISLSINGLLQNVATECAISKGYIGLQSEGTPIEFRNIALEPLAK